MELEGYIVGCTMLGDENYATSQSTEDGLEVFGTYEEAESEIAGEEMLADWYVRRVTKIGNYWYDDFGVNWTDVARMQST